MQESDAKPGPGGQTPDSIDLVAQTRSLRRKMIFWRRIAWLLLGGIGIFALILWQRGELHRRACRTALAYYYAEAEKINLGSLPLETIETDWRALKAPPELMSPHHYNLIARNWRTQPAAGEKLPLAVCRDAHAVLFWQDRHVLYSGGGIEWISESRVHEIVQAALRDDGR